MTLLRPPSSEAQAPMQQPLSDEVDTAAAAAESSLPVATPIPGRSDESTRFTDSLAAEPLPLQPRPKTDPAAEEKLLLPSRSIGSSAMTPPTALAAAATEGRAAAATNGVVEPTMPLSSEPQPRLRAVHSAGRLGGLHMPLTSTASPAMTTAGLPPTSATAGFALSAAAATPASVRVPGLQCTAAASPIDPPQTTGTYGCWLCILVACLPIAYQLALALRLPICVS